jgi:hypothetical protein
LLASDLMAGNLYVGSALADAPANRGWLLGHFMPEGDIRHSDKVEIKWGVHQQGDSRAQWVAGETRTALIVLVRGRFRLDFPHRSVVLAEQGNYVVFDRIDHSWYAEEDSIILGVRWPSVPGYSIGLG